jgi:hypothetical protein
VSKQGKPPPRTLSPWDWATLEAAFFQIFANLGECDLVVHDLEQDLREGLLVSAWRSFDGNETRLLKPSEWLQWKLGGPLLYPKPDGVPHGPTNTRMCITYIDEKPPKFVEGHFFVRHRELDQRYPVTTSMRRADDKQPTQPLRGKPGPRTRTPTLKTKEEWPLHIARELIRMARAGEEWPAASGMLQFCENNWGWQPDIRRMQKLLKFLSG